MNNTLQLDKSNETKFIPKIFVNNILKCCLHLDKHALPFIVTRVRSETAAERLCFVTLLLFIITIITNIIEFI